MTQQTKRRGVSKQISSTRQTGAGNECRIDKASEASETGRKTGGTVVSGNPECAVRRVGCNAQRTDVGRERESSLTCCACLDGNAKRPDGVDAVCAIECRDGGSASQVKCPVCDREKWSHPFKYKRFTLYPSPDCCRFHVSELVVPDWVDSDWLDIVCGSCQATFFQWAQRRRHMYFLTDDAEFIFMEWLLSSFDRNMNSFINNGEIPKYCSELYKIGVWCQYRVLLPWCAYCGFHCNNKDRNAWIAYPELRR